MRNSVLATHRMTTGRTKGMESLFQRKLQADNEDSVTEITSFPGFRRLLVVLLSQ